MVLIVDNNPESRSARAGLLRGAGHDIREAADYDDAKAGDALVVCVAGGEAAEVCRRIKASSRTAHLPILVIGADASPGAHAAALDSGADLFLSDPVAPEVLVSAVRSLVRSVSNASGLQRENDSLKAAQERFALLAETVPAVLFSNRPDGSAEYTSPRFQEYTDMTPGEAGVLGSTALHPEDREPCRQEWARCLAAGEPLDGEYRLGREGAYHWFRVRSRPMRDASGAILKWFGIALDIDDQKRAAEAMLVSQKLESVGQLAAGIAHDFNNLLATIMGGTSMALSSLGPDHPSRSVLANALEASERAADLTRQLLAYSGKGRFTVQRLDVSAAISAIMGLIRAVVSTKIHLKLDLARDLLPVEMDPRQLEQLALNLVSNAAESVEGKSNAAICLRTAVVDLAGCRVTDRITGNPPRPGEYVLFEVADTGTGIDAAILPRIFEPFFSTKFVGRGLGLAAVAGIVRACGGALDIITAAGAGTVFRVYLPPAEGAERRREQACILVVDDEAMVQKLARAVLENAGYRALSASDGAQALEVLSERGAEISLMLLDLTMPVLGGEDTFQEVQKLYADLPVIVSSGYAREQVLTRFDTLKPLAFLQKPYTASRLLAAVRSALMDKSSGTAAR